MAVPNKQPSGSRPGPKAPNTHGVYDGNANTGGFKPDTSNPRGGHPGDPDSKNGVASHGTPKGVGANKRNPLH